MPTDHGPIYIGLMSGTSLDGVDAVLVAFPPGSARLHGHIHKPYPEELTAGLRRLCTPGPGEIDACGEFDRRLGEFYAETVNQLLARSEVAAAEVAAIGSHGQTVRHRPEAPYPFTLQIGDPNVVALRTGIATVADFRRKDMAAGGQGAPLVPPFHEYLFRRDGEDRAVLNLGGIANVTLLPSSADKPVIGFDTGPANTLMDAWCRRHLGEPYDANGAWAASGQVDFDLLDRLSNDRYFFLPPPKSTGPEYFNLDWLEHRSDVASIPARNVQATLAVLTARTVADAVVRTMPACALVMVCGGGARNGFLMQQLRSCLPDVRLESTAAHGLEPDIIEAAAFAWLAHRTLGRSVGNLPTVTGARQSCVLGGIYPP